jgi:hypothetical protein
MRGYLAISDWANSLETKSSGALRLPISKKTLCIVPSLSIIRDVLIRVDPVYLDRALKNWNQVYGSTGREPWLLMAKPCATPST